MVKTAGLVSAVAGSSLASGAAAGRRWCSAGNATAGQGTAASAAAAAAGCCCCLTVQLSFTASSSCCCTFRKNIPLKDLNSGHAIAATIQYQSNHFPGQGLLCALKAKTRTSMYGVGDATCKPFKKGSWNEGILKVCRRIPVFFFTEDQNIGRIKIFLQWIWNKTRTGKSSFACDRPRGRFDFAARLRSRPLFIIEAAMASETNSARKGCREAATLAAV